MTCREFAEFLAEYESSEMSPTTRARFDAHLAECEDCVAYLESYRRTIEAARSAYDPDSAIAAEVPETLIQAILGARIRADDDGHGL